MSASVFHSFFDWTVCFLVLSFVSCLYILKINLSSVASFANIFSFLRLSSHRVDSFFFAVQKLLSLIRSRLFVFVFVFITLGSGLHSTGSLALW